MSWVECGGKWVWVLSWRVLSVWVCEVSAAGAEWWSAIADCLWKRWLD
jgi:hypothetical protein